MLKHGEKFKINEQTPVKSSPGGSPSSSSSNSCTPGPIGNKNEE